MIDKKFWKKIAENWVKDNDGIELPKDSFDITNVVDIKPELASFDDAVDDEIDDILADLGLDE